jgi:hypothetical protein
MTKKLQGDKLKGDKLKGGKIIASGGFGCIFKPALKCEDSDLRETNKISKLMTAKHANDEYKQIQKFNSVLNRIPNYEQYFLVDDFTLCKPEQLTTEDLSNYTKKCKALKKKDITKKNINQSLDKILALNMPYGGIDIEDFVKNYFVINSNLNSNTNTNIIKLNNSLIDLLINGILPMNKLNVFHCDIKDANVLVKPTDTKLTTRLIDWGLSLIHNLNEGIPRKLYRRPFQYNVPFSSVLFNKEFLRIYYDFLKINVDPDYFQIREFVVNYIFVWNEIRGAGHLSAINDIVKKLTIKDLVAVKHNKIKAHLVEYDFTYYYIIEYLSQILKKYTQNGKFDMVTYFNTIFLKNIDIWGFVMIYISLYEYLYNSFETLNEYQMQFIDKIKYIIIHYLYESPIEEINVSSLANELTKLNSLIENFGIDKPSKKIEYFNSFKNEVESGGKTINKTRKKLGSRKLGSRKLGSKKLGSKKLGPRTRKLGTKKL